MLIDNLGRDLYGHHKGYMMMITAKYMLAAAIAVTIGGLAVAQDFPTKSIQLVVPAAPGGSPDILARIIAPALSARLGQPVTVDNRPGGAGNIASQYVAQAQPDGHTLLIATDIVSINETLFPKFPVRAKNFVPIVQAISAPQVLVLGSAQAPHTLQEFLSSAKASPNKYSIASPAIGTTGQLGVLLLQSQAQIKVKPVVYRSAAPAITDVLGGHADGVMVTLAPTLPHIKSGQLRAIAVSTGKRSPALPNVPTFAEQGLPDFVFDSWQGFSAPAGTPRAVVIRLNREINLVLSDPAIRSQLLQQAFDPVGGTPENFQKLINDSITSWAGVIATNNIKVD
jgi:tripartite-type tricarboxylate transporter receptor subunit TctC